VEISSWDETIPLTYICSLSTGTKLYPLVVIVMPFGSSCGFCTLGSSSSNPVIFTTSATSASILKPLAYRTTICSGMIFLEATTTGKRPELRLQQLLMQKWLGLVLSRAAARPDTLILLPLSKYFVWINKLFAEQSEFLLP